MSWFPGPNNWIIFFYMTTINIRKHKGFYLYSAHVLSRRMCALSVISILLFHNQVRAEEPSHDHGYAGVALAMEYQPTWLTKTNTELSGLEAGFRIHGAPALALQLGTGWLQGTEAHGQSRWELPVQLHAQVYFNPGDEFQGYFATGFRWSYARLGDPLPPAVQQANSRSYFGGFLGLGFEVFVARTWSIQSDVRLWARSRVDGHRLASPEWRTDSGEARNTQIGTLLSLGINWYMIQAHH
jgi:hypothetical protein